MIIKEIDKYKDIYGKVDAFIMVNKDNIIQYSAMVNDDRTYMNTKNVIGKNLYVAYPNLTEENSTHSRVMRTGKPIIGENQLIVEESGKAYVIKTSTFPIENDGEIIGTFDVSSSLTWKSKNDEKESRSKLYTVDSIITRDDEMNLIKNKIMKVSKNDSPVMVTGESGTGKELVVEAIHSASRRCGKPFISLNCAAVPDSLMESTLFGTVKGSFTGAENRKGIFELADGGTLFLDEINSMSVEMQAKLLKVVEEQRYMRVGGEKYVDVDVRIISAMNIDPYEAIKNNLLRQDLFYRLSVIQFVIPPLRSRKIDIPILVDYFVGYYNKKMKKKVKYVDSGLKQIFMEYSWPGNVRELRNVIESAFNMTENERIKKSDIPEYLKLYNLRIRMQHKAVSGNSLSEAMAEYEKNIIIETLKNVSSLSEAAAELKITRQAVKYKIEKYEIDYTDILGMWV